MAELFQNTGFQLIGLYGSGLLLLGLITSYLLRKHSARAHQVLVLSMLTIVLIPGLYQIANVFHWGLWKTTPIYIESIVQPESSGKSISLNMATEIQSSNPTPLAVPSAQEESHAELQQVPSIAKYWFFLCIIPLATLLVAFLRTYRWVTRSEDVRDLELQGLLQTACKKLSLKKPVILATHQEMQTPSIWCWGRRAVLLLPRDSFAQGHT
ncbi:MAG: hypothetical protein HQ515_15330, partial [Phycisphaeraceae bacterium]|nr:hypothetical protein [Phycisphaeraceae bacterium]